MLTTEQQEVARRVAHDWADRLGSTAFALASGSLVEGYGNGLSDIDVYLVGSGPGFDGREEHVARGNLKLELTRLSTSRIKEHFAQCFAAGAAAPVSVNFYDALLAHRFLTALPLMGHDAFRSFMAGHQSHRLAQNLAEQRAEESVDAFRDFVGMAQAGDHESAAVAAKRAADFAVDMVLAQVGDTNPVSKWRVKRLRKHGGSIPDIARGYLSVVFPFFSSHIASALEYASECVKLFHRCHERRARAECVEVVHDIVRETARHPLCYVRAKGSQLFLVCPGSVFSIGPGTAARLLSLPLAALDLTSFGAPTSRPRMDCADLPPALRELAARGILMSASR